MPNLVIDFSTGPPRIALIVRGKQGPDHHPDTMEQHADVILPDGSPVGFFGEGNDSSFNRMGTNMQGVVYDYPQFQVKRPFYVNLNAAISYRLVSTVLIIQVTRAEADSFRDYWGRLVTNPGTFNIVGGNCSTHASDAFIAAGVVSHEIPGLDTPDHLYQQLVDELPAASVQSLTGFVGFNVKHGGGYDLEIQQYTATPRVNAPNPHPAAYSGGSPG